MRRISAERVGKEDNDGKRATAVNHVLTNVVDIWLRLLAPFAPHICEEAWEKFSGKGYVSTTSWPSPNEKLVDMAAEEKENYLMKVSEDTREIIRVTNIKPKRIFYFTSPKWMHDVYKLMLEAASKDGAADVGSVMKGIMSKPFAKGKEKTIAKFIQSAYNSTIKIMPRHLVQRRIKAEFDEKSILEDALTFLKNQFSAELKVFDAEDRDIYDPAKKSSVAQPYRPSIYIEG
jgi:leucyl-tRNA synthetase